MDTQFTIGTLNPDLKNLTKTDWQKWEEAVAQAKLLLEERFELKMEVAKIAIDICKINGIFMKDFAAAIGMKKTTLSEWVSLYKVVHSKIPKKLRSGHAINMESYKKIRKIITKNPQKDPKAVIALYLQKDSVREKWDKYVSRLQTIVKAAKADNVPEDIKEELLHEVAELKYFLSKNKSAVK